MTLLRRALIASGSLAALLLAAAGVACSPVFQTWAARRALAARPEWRVSVGEISVGWRSLVAREVTWEVGGGVLRAPRVEADVAAWDVLWWGKADVSRLVARRWTLDLSKPGAAAGAPAAARAFVGALAGLALPGDLAIDGVDLEGEVALPEGRGRARVTVGGGGIGARRDGKLDFAARAELGDGEVSGLDVKGEAVTTLDAERRVTRLVTRFAATASGRRFPQGASLRGEVGAVRTANGEAYVVTMTADGRAVVNVVAEFSPGTRRLGGTWEIDVRDGDVAPFVWNRPLPVFAATGRGTFGTEEGGDLLRATGRLDATAGRLERLAPVLAALGELRLGADFDLATRGGEIGVGKCELEVGGPEPVLIARSAQAFDFNPRTGEVRATDDTRELLGVSLRAVPLAWVKMWRPEVELSGGPLRGDLVATPRGGGIGFRTVAPLVAGGVDCAVEGRRIAERVDARLELTADYTPRGWQAEIRTGEISRAGRRLIGIDARIGRLAEADAPIKATGTFAGDLPGLLAQPVVGARTALTAGEATGEFTVSVGAESAAWVKAGLKRLAAAGREEGLPEATFTLRADFGADGGVRFDLPVTLAEGGRTSDLTVAGRIEPERERIRAFTAQVSGTTLDVGHARALLGVWLGENPRVTPVAPPWAGWSGTLALRLGSAIWSDALSLREVSGRWRVGPGEIGLEAGRAEFGERGRIALEGTVGFEVGQPKPYALRADVAATACDFGAWWRQEEGEAGPSPIEGTFDVSGRAMARAAHPMELLEAASGDFTATSRGGIFRGVPVRGPGAAAPAGGLVGFFASAGSMLGGLTGRKEEPVAIANRAEAVAELARGLGSIGYDQLSVMVSRGEAGHVSLSDFSLISPEVRLTGHGSVLPATAGDVREGALTLELGLRARGRMGELLRYLGALEGGADDFGYSAGAPLIRVAGTPGRPDVSDLESRLAALAMEKGGLTEKAVELLNRLRGAVK